MTRERAKQLWPLIKLYSEGRTVQFYDRSKKSFIDCNEPEFDEVDEYRVKPEHYEFWLLLGLQLATKEGAIYFADMKGLEHNEIKHMREVIDENN